MEMDLISNSTKPKKSVPTYGNKVVSGFPEYTSYKSNTDGTNSVIAEYMPKYNNAVKKSTTGGSAKSNKNSRKSNDSPRDKVRRGLVVLMVAAIGFSSGVMMERAGIPAEVGSSMQRVFDNGEMRDLAYQFLARYHVQTYPTDDHMHYFYGDGYIKEILKEPAVTPDLVAATYVATGSMAQAFNVLNRAVDAGKFKGDADALRDALYNNWDATRHKLTTDFKAANKDLNKLISNSALEEYGNSAKGAK